MHLVLFEPDIPQNLGTTLRLCACLGVAADVVEPCGFPFSDKGLRRAGMDYLSRARVVRHASWRAYQASEQAAAGRLVLLTTRARQAYTAFDFRADDRLVVGRESAGVPDWLHKQADAEVVVPLMPGMRSLNVAVAAAMVLGEALRQNGLFPALGGTES